MRDRRSDQAVKTPVAVTGKPSIDVPTGHPVGGGARFADSHLLAHDLRHHDPSFWRCWTVTDVATHHAFTGVA